MDPRRRLAILVACTALGSALAAATPAQALDCAGFKSAINNANDGDVITLDEGLTCTDFYPLKSSHPPPFSFTIQGAGSGATLDGSAFPGSGIIAGHPVAANTQLRVTIRNLTFRNGTNSSSGGAIELGGKDVSAVIDNDRFFHNTSESAAGDGGAVSIVPEATTSTIVVKNSTFGDGTASGGNFAAYGGALSLGSFSTGPSAVVTGNTFNGDVAMREGGAANITMNDPSKTVTVSGNRFVHNTSLGDSSDAGAGALFVGQIPATVDRNLFSDNLAEGGSVNSAHGGALDAEGDASTLPHLSQAGNVFDGNRVAQSNTTDFSSGGGGEWVNNYSLTSRADRFTNNVLPAGRGAGESEVLAGNKVGAGGEGAGVYDGLCTTSPVHLSLYDSTASGNTGGPAVSGNAPDKLALRSSIVAGNPGGDIGGFGAGRDATHSDACGPAVLPGAGNICANPALADAAHGNVHQTVLSPTLNAGANADIPAGLATDIDGQARIQNGVVDMGADEFVDPFAGVAVPAQTDKVRGRARSR
jgi:hypothetical protein